MIPPPPAAPVELARDGAASRRGPRGPVAYARRVATVLAEVAPALLADALSPPPADPILREEEGLAGGDGRRIALYVQFSPTGALSGMVRRQLALYRDEGFSVVLISVSPDFPEADWQAARAEAALIVHRVNHGRDFGAWRDLVGPVLRRWPGAEELLLVNDSVLGPLAPLGPVFGGLRAGGEGLFGLIESHGAGAHLQSNLLLARGAAAVADLARFLQALRPSRSKWLVVQRGELALSGWMRARGHRVGALFSYAAAIAEALRDPDERVLLRTLAGGGELTDLLLQRPLNPAHHLWRALLRLGCPFIKTELVRNNPWNLPGVDGWRGLVPAGAPCPLPLLDEHLRVMGA